MCTQSVLTVQCATKCKNYNNKGQERRKKNVANTWEPGHTRCERKLTSTLQSSRTHTHTTSYHHLRIFVWNFYSHLRIHGGTTRSSFFSSSSSHSSFIFIAVVVVFFSHPLPLPVGYCVIIRRSAKCMPTHICGRRTQNNRMCAMCIANSLKSMILMIMLIMHN